MNNQKSPVLRDRTWEERPLQSSGGLFAAMKEMQESFLDLAVAHSDHASTRIEKSFADLSKVFGMALLLGPLITVLLGLTTTTIVLYFGFGDQLNNSPDAFPVLIGMIVGFVVATIGSYYYIKSNTIRAKNEIANIQKEFKRDLRLVGKQP